MATSGLSAVRSPRTSAADPVLSDIDDHNGFRLAPGDTADECRYGFFSGSNRALPTTLDPSELRMRAQVADVTGPVLTRIEHEEPVVTELLRELDLRETLEATDRSEPEEAPRPGRVETVVLGQKLYRVRRADHHERSARGLVRDRDLQVRAERLERADDADDTFVARERLRVRAAAEELLRACLRRRGVACLEADGEPAGLEAALLENEADPTDHGLRKRAARTLEREARHEEEVRSPDTARLHLLADRARESRFPRRRRGRRHPDLTRACIDVARRRVRGDALHLARPRVDAMYLVGNLVRRPHRSLAVGETCDPRFEREGSRCESPAGVDAPYSATLGIGRPHRASADREINEKPGLLQRQASCDRVRGAVDLGDGVALGDPDVAVACCDVLGPDLPDPGDDPVRSRVDA